MIKNLLPVFLCSLLFACAGLPENTTPASTAMEDSGKSYVSIQSAKHRKNLDMAETDELMVLLSAGVDSFASRIALIEDAQESIDLQYYLFHSDLSGGLIIAALWRAAERGVRIRVLVDDIDLEGSDSYIAKLDAHPNFEVRIFNPFLRSKGRIGQYITGLGTVTRRMHNKTFTVDGSAAILGGRNLADEYFGADPNVHFGDLDVLFTGEAVKDVQQSFDLYWNNQLSYGINLLSDYQVQPDDIQSMTTLLKEFEEQNKDSLYSIAVRDDNIVELIRAQKKREFQGNAIVLYDDPLKIVSSHDQLQYNLEPKLEAFVNTAQKELVLISPYFVPGKEGMALFETLLERGLKIKILTNSMMSNDVKIVHAGYSKYRKKLLAMGIELHEVDVKELKDLVERSHKKRSSNASKLALHAKFYVMDQNTTFIGSFNLDPRSRYENTEVGIVIQSEALGQHLVKDFNKNIDLVAFKLRLEDGDIIWTKTVDGKTITYTEEPYSSWWDRFKNRVMRLLPVESQL
ncbi:phospholipase D family protein [Psychromonas marina]|uniref:Phospholipase D family protein n=1 Tax=Psychromonas marina TaxID=88364 RepID=A0ABQ6DYS3_9GAMM|nr:phospholipase D family protein [Psychromonas marina]GLS89896.1 phospholipase D family protein [Psychromonas marina]